MAAFDNLSNPSEYLAYWGKTYRNELLSNILPFWMKYGLDKENGGYFTCVDRDGTLMDSTKSVWFQGRFAFILAYAYNHIEKNIRPSVSKQCFSMKSIPFLQALSHSSFFSM